MVLNNNVWIDCRWELFVCLTAFSIHWQLWLLLAFPCKPKCSSINILLNLSNSTHSFQDLCLSHIYCLFIETDFSVPDTRYSTSAGQQRLLGTQVLGELNYPSNVTNTNPQIKQYDWFIFRTFSHASVQRWKIAFYSNFTNNKLAKLRRHASRVHFAKIHFG